MTLHDNIIRLDVKLNYVLKLYIESFEKKHKIKFECAINGYMMGVIRFDNEMYVSINDIIIDIDEDVSVDTFADWYWTVHNKSTGLYINYSSWVMGLRPEDLLKCKKT